MFGRKILLSLTFTMIIITSLSIFSPYLGNRIPRNYYLVYDIRDAWCKPPFENMSRTWINGTVSFSVEIRDNEVYYETWWINGTASEINSERWSYLYRFNETIELSDEWYWFEMKIYKYAVFLCPHAGFTFVPIFNPTRLVEALERFADHYGMFNVSITRNGSRIYFIGYLPQYRPPYSLIVRILMIIDKYGVPVYIENGDIRFLTLLKERVGMFKI
ncbi:MAG: hypothetical protein ACTSX9_09145 [Candidatus Njordarchaeales archaeon]